MNKRAITGMLSGAALGVLCILGMNIRMGDQVTAALLFSVWLNRLITGMIIGFYTPVSNGIMQAILRGAGLGFIVSLSLYTATDFLDLTGFIAGIIYGIIIDLICTRFGASEKTV